MAIKIKNARATDVREKVTKREYVGYGANTLGTCLRTAIPNAYGGLIASTYLGLSAKAFTIYTTITVFLSIWDVINDIMVGNFVDKTKRAHKKWGRFKPIIFLSFVPCLIISLANGFPFADWFPSTGNVFKVSFLVVIYLLNDIFSTFSTAATGAMNARQTTNNDERGYLAGLAGIITSIFGSCGSWIWTIVIWLLPNTPEATRYFYSLLITAVIGVPMQLYNLLVVKERIVDLEKAEVPRLRDIYKQVVTNRPLMSITISGILNVGMTIGYGVLAYICRCVIQVVTIDFTIFGHHIYKLLDNEGAILSIMSLTTMIPTGLSLIIAPFIRKHIDDKVLMIIVKFFTSFCYIGMLLSVVPMSNYTMNQLFFRVSFWYALHGLTTGFYNIVPSVMTMTAYDYAEYKYSQRNEASVSAISNTFTKIAVTLGTYAFNLCLVGIGYLDNTDPSTMAESTKQWLLIIFPLFPAVFAFLSAIPLFFFNVTGKKHKMMVEQLNIQRQESLDSLNRDLDKMENSQSSCDDSSDDNQENQTKDEESVNQSN